MFEALTRGVLTPRDYLGVPHELTKYFTTLLHFIEPSERTISMTVTPPFSLAPPMMTNFACDLSTDSLTQTYSARDSHHPLLFMRMSTVLTGASIYVLGHSNNREMDTRRN